MTRVAAAADLLAQKLRTGRVTLDWLEEPFDVIVRAVSFPVSAKAERLAAEAEDRKKDFHNEAWIVAQCVIDEHGDRLYDDDAWQRIAAEMDPVVIDLIAAKAYELATPTDEQLDGIKKNLRAKRSEISGESPSASDSPIPT